VNRSAAERRESSEREAQTKANRRGTFRELNPNAHKKQSRALPNAF
jgi:hypothetical protein